MMNQEKFPQQGKEGEPHFLDREHAAPIRNSKPREAIEEDLLEFFRIAKHEEEYRGKDETKISKNLTEILIRYAGIDNNVRYMDELIGNFRGLGYEVAFLVDSLKSRRLADEQFLWLGSLKPIPGKAGMEEFEFAGNLESLRPIKDCDDHEKVRLYLAYLAGQVSYWNSKYSPDFPKESKK